MAKAAFYLSLFGAASAAASFVGWLVALSALFHALAWWLVAFLILGGIALVAFDDGFIALLGIDEPNAYYGSIAGGLVAITIGVALTWICR